MRDYKQRLHLQYTTLHCNTVKQAIYIPGVSQQFVTEMSVHTAQGRERAVDQEGGVCPDTRMLD